MRWIPSTGRRSRPWERVIAGDRGIADPRSLLIAHREFTPDRVKHFALDRVGYDGQAVWEMGEKVLGGKPPSLLLRGGLLFAAAGRSVAAIDPARGTVRGRASFRHARPPERAAAGSAAGGERHEEPMNESSPSDRARLRAIARRAMARRGLDPDFPPAAQEEVRRARAASPDSIRGLRDLRELPWCSIDNDDSRDLDQLSVSAPGRDGTVQILVAVADVDALVARGSAVDAHARANTTSVYTAAVNFPMLPERLSTDLTSLGLGEDRPAAVIEMSVDTAGGVVSSQVYRAWVRNRAKLAYGPVAAWLDGRGPIPPPVAAAGGMEDQLRVQDRVAQAMRKCRLAHGALVLRTLEARATFRADALADFVSEEKNRAKELIEDFMIAANGVTARFLEGCAFPSVRRILRTPARWDRLVTLAAEQGERLPAGPDPRALQQFLARRQEADPARFPDLSLSVIKLLGPGEYVIERPGEEVGGHFGLAVTAYTHSTAPNRRFPDLITQRLLKAALDRQPLPYPASDLSQLARHCTEQEDNVRKIERQVRKSAAALLLAPRIGATFDALVTGRTEKGTWVRTLHPPVEGKVVQGAPGLDVGDRVRVRLLSVDVDQGFIDFARA